MRPDHGPAFLPGNVFDAVYSEHFFERIPRKAAIDLLTDCHRALRPGGRVRIAMPDLRKFAQTYLGAGRHPEVHDAIKAEFGEVSGTNCELLNFGMEKVGAFLDLRPRGA